MPRSMLMDEQEIDHPRVHRNLPRSVKDPIHDYIPISPRVSAFIDTRQFQRLRSIKQLGTSYYVWPGASHNRFEHCLGVAYLSRLLAEHLQKNQPELGITDRDVECVEIAGLCHDLGHGPWSHVWDGLFIPMALKDKRWKHEDGSEMMFDYLVRDNGISITPEDDKFIKALIAGDPDKCSKDEKRFLFHIVANKRNGIDVDKFDYICRDSHMIGDQGNLSLQRLIKSARVIDNEICYDIKDANQIHEICYTRFRLHKMIYNHKTAKAIEYMIIDALLLAEAYMRIAAQVDKPEKYLHLTDNIMPTIEATECPELAPARAIFDRIRTRDLYKCVDYKVISWEHRELCKAHITPQRIVEAAKALPVAAFTSLATRIASEASTPSQDIDDVDESTSYAGADTLEAKHVIVDMSPMHYGMQEKNPLDSVKFYSKNNPNKSAQALPGDYSMLMPAVFAEVMLRVYTRDIRYFGIIQAGYRAVLETMPDFLSHHLPPLSRVPSLDMTAAAPTPPATEAPSTPRAHSRNSSFTLPSGGPGSAATPQELFLNNEFTTVAPNYVPQSPTRRHRNPRSKKRERDGDGDADGSTPKKRRS